MKVYLSPSQQESNIGVGAYGSESYRCQDIADRARRLLVGVGIDVKQTPRDWEPLSGTEWLAKVVAASNDWGADRHTCIHTNAASDKAIHGTDAWHYPGSVKGKALTEAIYGRVVEVSGKGAASTPSPSSTRRSTRTRPVPTSNSSTTRTGPTSCRSSTGPTTMPAPSPRASAPMRA